MSVLTLSLLAVFLPLAGALVTLLLARRIPLSVLEHASQHGRFAHLSSQERSAVRARLIPVDRHPSTGGLRTA